VTAGALTASTYDKWDFFILEYFATSENAFSSATFFYSPFEWLCPRSIVCNYVYGTGRAAMASGERYRPVATEPLSLSMKFLQLFSRHSLAKQPSIH